MISPTWLLLGGGFLVGYNVGVLMIRTQLKVVETCENCGSLLFKSNT